MSTIGKVFVVLNLLLAGLFLGYASTALATTSEWKSKYEDEQAAHQETASTMEGEMTSVRSERDSARLDLDEARQSGTTEKTRADQAEADLRDARAQVDTLTTAVSGIQAKLSDLDSQLAEIESSKDDAVASRVTAENERDDALDARDDAVKAQRDAEDSARRASDQIADLQGQLQGAQGELSRAETTLAAVVAEYNINLDGVGAIPKIEAAVLGINYDLPPGLVALNKGKSHGVKKGFVFDIFADNYKAQVKVVDVEDNVCSAVVVRAVDGQIIRQGDRATTQL